MFILKTREQLEKAIVKAKKVRCAVKFRAFGNYSVKGSTGFYLKNAGESSAMTETEQAEIGLKALELVRDVMISNLIFPKITLEPSENSIWIEEVGENIDIEDFQYFSAWLMTGAQSNKKK